MTTAYITNDTDFHALSFSDFMDTNQMWMYIVIGSCILCCCCCAALCFVGIKKRNRKRTDFIGGTQINVPQKQSDIVIIKTASITMETNDMQPSGGSNVDPALVEWLQSSLELAEYADNFIQHGYSNMNMIQQIGATSQLTDIGITKKVHQTVILDEISRLKHCNTLPNHKELRPEVTKSVIEIKMGPTYDNSGANVVHINMSHPAVPKQEVIFVEQGGMRMHPMEMDVDALIDNMGDLPAEEGDDCSYNDGNMLTVEGPIDNHNDQFVSGIREEGDEQNIDANNSMNVMMQAIGEDINHMTDIGDIVAGV